MSTNDQANPPAKPGARSPQPRVLIADDEIVVRSVLKSVIRQLNLCLVGEAKNGAEAVELYRKEKPDLLLLDFNMPVKTGDEVLQELKREFPQATIVMLTSVADLETVKNCIQHGATNYVRKDQNVNQIRKVLTETLKKTSLS